MWVNDVNFVDEKKGFCYGSVPYRLGHLVVQYRKEEGKNDRAHVLGFFSGFFSSSDTYMIEELPRRLERNARAQIRADKDISEHLSPRAKITFRPFNQRTTVCDTEHELFHESQKLQFA